jgi:hypothetical protein
MPNNIPTAMIALLSPLICRRGGYAGSQQNQEKRARKAKKSVIGRAPCG